MEAIYSSEPLVTIHSSSILKMETVYFFEMLGSTYKTKRCMNVINSWDSTMQRDTDCMLEHIWWSKDLNILRGLTVFGDISINHRIILKCKSEKWGVRGWTGFNCLSVCDPAAFIKERQFLSQTIHYQILKKTSPRSLLHVSVTL